MDTKNNLAWNDCTKCKNYDMCYYCPAGIDEVLKSIQTFILSLYKRDLCVNNGKRFFKDKEEAVQG